MQQVLWLCLPHRPGLSNRLSSTCTFAFYEYLGAIFDSGFGNRVMFGSDQMVWPGTIERGIRTVNEAPFLSADQKRDILYNNAARFLRLDSATVARHHRGGS